MSYIPIRYTGDGGTEVITGDGGGGSIYPGGGNIMTEDFI